MGQHVSFLTCSFETGHPIELNIKVQKSTPTVIFTLSIGTDRAEQKV